jgi:hypothetical protein
MLVNARYDHTTMKVLQRPFVIFRFARIVNALIEFCEGDGREGETFLPLEFLQTLHNTLMIVEVWIAQSVSTRYWMVIVEAEAAWR